MAPQELKIQYQKGPQFNSYNTKWNLKAKRKRSHGYS